jgi:hypothetical protein
LAADETIATLPERKRAVIGARHRRRSDDEATIVEASWRELRDDPDRHLRAVAGDAGGALAQKVASRVLVGQAS